MITIQRVLLLSLGVVLSPLGMLAHASEIPSDLEPASAQPDSQMLKQAGLTPDQAKSMDRVELAEVEKTDLHQKGGDAIVTVAVIAAIVIIVYIAVQHMNHI